MQLYIMELQELVVADETTLETHEFIIGVEIRNKEVNESS